MRCSLILVKLEKILTKKGIKFFNITDISRQALYDSSLSSGDRLHPSGKMYALWVDRVIEYVSNLKY